MGTEDDSGSQTPYGAATQRNTGLDWLNNITNDSALTVQLTGMSGYAKALVAIGTDLLANQTQIMQQLGTAIEGGAFDGGFPEVSYAAQMHGQNMGEFYKYLGQLMDGVTHTGNAAQAVADSYGDSDDLSAVSMNAVNFAFGDPTATRPAGLPKWYAKTTFWDALAKQQAAAPADATQGHPDAVWTPVSTTMNSDGVGTTTYTDQYGETRTMTVSMVGNQKVTVMSGPEGKTTDTSSTYSYSFGSATTTTHVDAKGKVTTTETNTYDLGNTSTTDVTSGGKTQSETTVTYNDDGTETETTYTYDDKGNRTIAEQFTVAQDNPEKRGAPDSPDVDALKAQKTHIKTN